MRTRSQLNAWEQAKQLALQQQQRALEEFKQQQMEELRAAKAARAVARSTAQRKRKLQVVTSDAAATNMRSILDYISPTSKKAKREVNKRKQATPAAAPTASALLSSSPPSQLKPMMFKTPMKKRQLYIDTRQIELPETQQFADASTNSTCVGEPKSILDYISPNSKKANAETERVAAYAIANEEERTVGAAAAVLELKRPLIRRTLSYGSGDEVLSDDVSTEAVDNTEASCARTPSMPATGASSSNRESILHRICSARGDQRSLPLVGRTAEQAAIASVLGVGAASHTADATPSPSLFIIGPPGTGKSSSVNQLVAEYERRFPANAVVRVNCSMFTNPVALYTEVDAQLRRLSPWKLPYLDPCMLDEFLQDASRARVTCETVLVLDEVDQLLRLPPVTQKRVQDVLRFFVQWSTLPAAKVKFLGIMNGLDMHAQLAAFLPQAPAVPHVLFPAYTFNELLAILQSHVQIAVGDAHTVDDLVEQRALELIARKVGSRDGDVRRATSLLQQCARYSLRRSSESAVGSDGYQQITLRDVLACTTTMLAAGPVRDVHQLPRLPKIVLFAITALAPSGGKACNMDAVTHELARLRAAPGFAWVPTLSRDELQAHLASLECYALVKRPTRGAGATKAFWKAKLTSAVTLDVLDRAFHDDPLLRTLTQRVSA